MCVVSDGEPSWMGDRFSTLSCRQTHRHRTDSLLAARKVSVLNASIQGHDDTVGLQIFCTDAVTRRDDEGLQIRVND